MYGEYGVKTECYTENRDVYAFIVEAIKLLEQATGKAQIQIPRHFWLKV